VRLRKTTAVKSRTNKRFANSVRRINVKSRVDGTKITNMIKTCKRDRRDLIRECKMGIKNEATVTNIGTRVDRMSIIENKSRIVGFI